MAWTTSTWSPSFSAVLGVLAARHDIQVQFHRHPAPGQVQAGQQGRNGFAVGQFKVHRSTECACARPPLFLGQAF
jgi:hypothetical protein